MSLNDRIYDCPFCEQRRYCWLNKDTISQDTGQSTIIYHLECSACGSLFTGPIKHRAFWISVPNGLYDMKGSIIAGPFATWEDAKMDLPNHEGHYVSIVEGEADEAP